MGKRAYSPKEISAKKWVTVSWGEQWSEPFGFPAENASWFISGRVRRAKVHLLCSWARNCASMVLFSI